jgi:predicted RND superfamily exporter protein
MINTLTVSFFIISCSIFAWLAWKENMARALIWFRDHPRTVIFVIAAITIFFISRYPYLKVDSSVDSLIITTNESYDYYKQTRKDFISDNISVVYIEDRNLFTKEKLTEVENIFYELKEVPGITQVDGLYNAKNFNGTSGILNTDPLIVNIPEQKAELENIRWNAMRNPLLMRNLISKDGGAIAINIIADNTTGEKEFNLRVTRDIDRVIKKLEGRVEKVFQLGTPYTRSQISSSIINDLAFFISAAVIMVLIMLIFMFQNVYAAILPMITGGLSLVCALGFMPLVDIPINILTAIVPPMLLGLGCSEDVHIISEFYDARDKSMDCGDAIAYLAPHIGKAIVITSFTTFAGCLSVNFNEITLIKQFGIVSSFGLIMNFFITVAVIPVYLRFLGHKLRRKKPHDEEHEHTVFHKISDIFINITFRHRKPVVICTFIVVLIAILGIYRLRLDNDLLAYFKEQSPIRTRSALCNQMVSGAQIFYIILSSPEEGAFNRSENIKIIYDIQDYIKKAGLFDFTISLADHVALIEREMNYGRHEFYQIPHNDDLISQHLLLYHSDDLDRYITFKKDRSNIIVRHNIASSAGLKDVLGKLDVYIQQKYGKKLNIRFTGENILFLEAADTMSSGLGQSIASFLLLLFLTMTLFLRDVKLAFISLIPNILPIVIVYAIMGFSGVPINVGTTMIAVITMGVLVDDTTHLMYRFRTMVSSGMDRESIIKTLLYSESRPVISNSVSLFTGFMVITLSNFVPVIYFGFFSGLINFFGLFSELLITPAILYFVYFKVRESEKWGKDEELETEPA